MRISPITLAVIAAAAGLVYLVIKQMRDQAKSKKRIVELETHLSTTILEIGGMRELFKTFATSQSQIANLVKAHDLRISGLPVGPAVKEPGMLAKAQVVPQQAKAIEQHVVGTEELDRRIAQAKRQERAQQAAARQEIQANAQSMLAASLVTPPTRPMDAIQKSQAIASFGGREDELLSALVAASPVN